MSSQVSSYIIVILIYILAYSQDYIFVVHLHVTRYVFIWYDFIKAINVVILSHVYNLWTIIGGLEWSCHQFLPFSGRVNRIKLSCAFEGCLTRPIRRRRIAGQGLPSFPVDSLLITAFSYFDWSSLTIALLMLSVVSWLLHSGRNGNKWNRKRFNNWMWIQFISLWAYSFFLVHNLDLIIL